MEFARSVLTMIRNQSLSNVIKLRLAITIVTASRKYGQQYPIFIKLQEGSIEWVEEREVWRPVSIGDDANGIRFVAHSLHGSASHIFAFSATDREDDLGTFKS